MLARFESWYDRQALIVRTVVGGALAAALFSLLMSLPDLVPGLADERRTVPEIIEGALMFGAMGAVAGGVYGILWPRLARLGRIGNALAAGIAVAAAFVALLGCLLALRDAALLREVRLWLLAGGVGFGAGSLLGLIWRGVRLDPRARGG